MLKVLLILFLFLLPVNTAFAETNVNVSQNTGKSTVCINGECTTSDDDSNNKVKVCVDDKCFESDGDLEVNEGDSHISIKNSNGTNTVSVKSTGSIKTSVKVDTKDDEDNEDKTRSDEEDKEDEDDDKKQQDNPTSIFEKIAKIFENIFPIFKF